MSVKSLPVKYRPQSFEDICSQESIIKILKRQLSTGTFKNAYLFCGASGCGKTTIARIFASEINRGVGFPIEIDAASNNGVDNVKQLIKAAYERSLDSEYKIVIVDECHSLTSQAWQAFLKCIEEPPKYTIFMFCTTDPQKIPSTILNRVMRFNLTRISHSVIVSRLEYIAKSESLIVDNESIDYIAKLSEGSMRAAVAFLDKVASFSNNVTIKDTLDALGNYSYKAFFRLLNAIIDGDESVVYKAISYYYDEGNDLKLLIEQFLNFVLDVAKYDIFKSCDVTRLPKSFENDLRNAVNFENSSSYYRYYIEKLLSLKNMLKNDSSPRSTIEIVLTQMARLK